MRPLRLLLAATAVAGLAVSSLSPAPAHAADPITDGTIQMDGSLNYDHSSCAGADDPADVEAAFTAGSTVKRTLSFDGTATATGDETDTVRMKGSQTLTVSSTVAGGQLTSFTATSTVTGSTTQARTGSACRQGGGSFPPGGGNQAMLEADVHRSTAGWLHVQASSTGVGGQILGVGFGGAELMQSQLGGYAVRDISHDHWVYVPAGEHHLEVQLGGASVAGYGLESLSIKQSVKLTFLPAGVARTATAGKARTRVAFPSTLTCSSGKAAVRLTSKVKGASKVTLYVDGVRKATVSRPGKARTVTLTGVPKERAVTLKAVVAQGHRTLAATRSYRSC